MTFEPHIQKIIDEMTNICESMNVYELILYGSRANGTAMETSDIDVAIVCDNCNIEELKEAFEEIHTLLKFDVVDLKRCKNETLRKEIETHGISLYRQI